MFTFALIVFSALGGAAAMLVAFLVMFAVGERRLLKLIKQTDEVVSRLDADLAATATTTRNYVAEITAATSNLEAVSAQLRSEMQKAANLLGADIQDLPTRKH